MESVVDMLEAPPPLLIDCPLPDLKDDEYESIDRGVWEDGFETLAFYKSLHFLNDSPFDGEWGIFIFDYAIRSVADEIQGYYPGKWHPEVYKEKATRFLYCHERFHFRFDAWALSHEAVAKKPLYEDYLRGFYRRFHPLEYVYEESLANNHAYISMRYEDIAEFMEDFLERQPGAYSVFKPDLNEFRSRLAASFFHGADSIKGEPVNSCPEHASWIAAANGHMPLLKDGNCPVHVIRNCSPGDLVPPSIGGAPPTLKIYKKFVRNYLAGEFHSRTDHEYYTIDNGLKIKIPNPHEKQLKPWEFTGTLKKAGMSVKEYIKERARTNTWKKHVPRQPPKPPLETMKLAPV
jgi:hypothetical protein